MLENLRQRRGTVSAGLLPMLLLAWCVSAAGVCPHAQASDHPSEHHGGPVDSHPGGDGYAHDHLDHPDHDVHYDHHDHRGDGDSGSRPASAAADTVAEHHHCDRDICPYCEGDRRPGGDAVLAFCAVCVADGAAPTAPGYSCQPDADEPTAQPVLFVADLRPDRCARGQPPPDAAALPQPVPIHLRHCIFLN